MGIGLDRVFVANFAALHANNVIKKCSTCNSYVVIIKGGFMKFLILVFSILLTLYGCDLIDSPSDNSSTLHKSVISGGIEYSLDIPTNNFLLNDTLSISFKVKNNSPLLKEFNFSNIQQLAYQVIDQNNNVATYYPNIVLPALSQFSLKLGETKVLDQIGLFKDNNGNYINRGNYSLVVFLMDNNSPKLDLKITVN